LEVWRRVKRVKKEKKIKRKMRVRVVEIKRVRVDNEGSSVVIVRATRRATMRATRATTRATKMMTWVTSLFLVIANSQLFEEGEYI
jgi:hypothetical protein